MTPADAAKILGCPMDPDSNDAGAGSVREYMTGLVKTIWHEGEGFSGKRPFGNSGWESEVYTALVKAGVVKGTIDADGYADDYDTKATHKLVAGALEFL